MNILQKIFSEHFHKLNNSGIKIRNTVIENVDKMIHCGIYAKHHRHEGKLKLFISKEKRRFHTNQNVWRTSISLSFHFDPLLCKCGHEMTLLKFYLKGTPFFENYKNLVNSS